MFHFQNSVQAWPRAVQMLPDGALVKAIDRGDILRDVKTLNPRINTMLRHHGGPQAIFDGRGFEGYKNLARQFFATFVDATFREQYARHTDFVQEWNEYLASSHTGAELQDRIDWARAAAWVWKHEYQPLPEINRDGNPIRLALVSAPVGNDIHRAFAEIALEYDCVLSYHAYDKFVGDHQRDPLSWRYHSGRWHFNEQSWGGLKPDWLFGEAGPYAGVWEGWRHPVVLNGDAAAYVEAVRTWIREIKSTPAYREGRVKGFALFTTGGTMEWRYYETLQPEMDQIAQMVRQEWTPPAPVIAPPPPPDNIALPARIVDYVDALAMNPESEDWPYETRPLSAVENVVIHHSAGLPTTPPESIAIGHINRNGGGAEGWPGIGYHFYVMGDGRIYKTNHLTTHSYHVGDDNRESIGVCLAGNFTNVHPSPAQLDATRFLVWWLSGVVPGAALRKHLDFMGTQCPGNTWPEWWAQLTEEPMPEPEPRAYDKEAHLVRQGLPRRLRIAVMDEAAKQMQSVFWSADDWALTLQSALATVKGRRLHAWNIDEILGLPEAEARQAIEDWVGLYYPDPPPQFFYHRIRSLFTANRWRSPVGTVEQRESGQVWPAGWVDATGYLTRYQLGSGYAVHTGADLNLNTPVFDMDRNKPVYAAASGKVTYAGVPSQAWQGVVIIRHQDAAGAVMAYTRYAHLQPDEITVRAEDWVKVGEMVGLTGRNMVGSSAGPFHLHFDVSTTSALLNDPGHWPGDNRTVVQAHYVDPKAWILARR